ncbi:hypothetical protein EK21DRAFT_104565 [Setomelanomma holmii]|uniref:Uncharacterized protein n=1 Tax=Setomelanomma holmii TaxID=210430 RepID=A0A9P4LHY5_9PLEO|nr:hypothetical protein EK21DRAFT_104565 [Setomelanomma holmii]
MIQGQSCEKVGAPPTTPLHNAKKKQKAEMQRFINPKPAPKLDDLSNLLFTRGRLQELGSTFTELGELITYGNPESRTDFDHMMRLGPIYDEQWEMFFVDPQAQQVQDDPQMWPDLRTLKRVLRNEGVVFGFDHRRLTHGNASEKLMRLCTVYDDLRKMWSAMRVFTRSPTPVAEQEEEDSSARYDSGGCNDEDVLGHPAPRSKLKDALGEARSVDARRDAPRHIGWRFSDDIDTNAVARYRDSMSENFHEEPVETLEVAIATPLPFLEGDSDRMLSPSQCTEAEHSVEFQMLSLQPANGGRLRHGPSPLQISVNASQLDEPQQHIGTQKTTMPSMMYSDEAAAKPRNNDLDSLAPNANMMATMTSTYRTDSSNEGKPSKKEGFKGWWRDHFGRREGAGISDFGSGGVSPWYMGG